MSYNEHVEHVGGRRSVDLLRVPTVAALLRLLLHMKQRRPVVLFPCPLLLLCVGIIWSVFASAAAAIG